VELEQEPDALARVIEYTIKNSPEYRKAESATARDSVYAALRSDRAWVDSTKRVAQNIETGFVALDPKSGGILAMVGGSNFKNFKYGLNHVTQIRGRWDPAFKPFVYTVAIDNGYAPSFEIQNQPVMVMMETEELEALEFRRRVRRKSNHQGSDQKVDQPCCGESDHGDRPGEPGHRLCQTDGDLFAAPPYASLALGVGDISPLEMASAFGVFPNHGVAVEPIAILKIEDKDGTTLEENFPRRREVFSDQLRFIMTSMLEGVVNGGTGSHVRDFFQLPAAGKTGTTQEFADAWFVGYTPRFPPRPGWASTTRAFISRRGTARRPARQLPSGDGS